MASSEEIRQIVEGKLAQAGHEPQNVQVLFIGGTPKDEEGEFLSVEVEEEETVEETFEPLRTEEQDGEEEIEALRAELEAMKGENAELRKQLDHGKARLREVWRTNCQCLAEYDNIITQKDAEIEDLKRILSEVSNRSESSGNVNVFHESSSVTSSQGAGLARTAGHKPRRGIVPPVDPFTGEEPDTRLDDWLPSLNRAAQWNEWTEEELLLRLAGHLRGRALQEWGLLEEASRETFQTAVRSLRMRIDPGSRTLAAQDFRHTTQGEEDLVADFIHHLEHTFQVAYGHDRMAAETRATLRLHGQLQEGLRHEAMRAPAVSGAQTYQELCFAARNEEKRLTELRKRQQYKKALAGPGTLRLSRRPVDPKDIEPSLFKMKPLEPRKCYLCHKAGHLARDCTRNRMESTGWRDTKDPRATAKHVTSEQFSTTDERSAVQDLFSKWPMVFAMPDQKTECIVRILVDETIPFCGVPEALLSDRGVNLLSHLMLDTCKLLGIKNLNTTDYHPQCDGLVERHNRTLKNALRKQAAHYGMQWDRLLPRVVWAYCNTPHEATQEKPSYLLFGLDCRTPSEVAASIHPTNMTDYREELTISLSSAREIAASCIQQAQKKYKQGYDRKARVRKYRVGEWVLVRLPSEETGKARKLSWPWHGPYRVVDIREPDMTAVKVYRPQVGQIQIHLSRVTPCPPAFPAGYYWYGDRRPHPGRPPKWIDKLLQRGTEETEVAEDSALTSTAKDQHYLDAQLGICSSEDKHIWSRKCLCETKMHPPAPECKNGCPYETLM